MCCHRTFSLRSFFRYSSGLYKAKNRLSRTFSFSPISSKNRLKKMLTSNSSLLHLNEKDNNNFNSLKRLSVPSRQDSFTSERNFPQSPSRFMHSIQECKFLLSTLLSIIQSSFFPFRLNFNPWHTLSFSFMSLVNIALPEHVQPVYNKNRSYAINRLKTERERLFFFSSPPIDIEML